MVKHAEANRKPASHRTRSRSDASGSSRDLTKTLYRHNIRLPAKLSKPDVSVMSSDRVLDYLTEELVVSKNIVRPS